MRQAAMLYLIGRRYSFLDRDHQSPLHHRRVVLPVKIGPDYSVAPWKFDLMNGNPGTFNWEIFNLKSLFLYHCLKDMTMSAFSGKFWLVK